MSVDAEQRGLQSVRTSLARKAALPPFSKREWVVWLTFTVFVQSLWGLWSVCTRYLQTIPPTPAPTLQLATMVNVIALPCTVLLTYLPSILAAARQAVGKCFNTSQQQEAALVLPTTVHSAAVTAARPNHADIASKPCKCKGTGAEQQSGMQLTACSVQDSLSEDQLQQQHIASRFFQVPDGDPRTDQLGLQQTHSMTCKAGTVAANEDLVTCQQQQQREEEEEEGSAASADMSGHPKCTQRLKAFIKRQSAAYTIGVFAADYNITIIYAAWFMNAYLVQLIALFVPVLVAMSSTYLLKQRKPPGLYITLFVAIGGSAMVIAGEWLEKSKQSDAASIAGKQHAAHDLIIGCVFAVASVVLSAAYTLSLQIFRTVTTSQQVMIANRNCSILLFFPLALGIEGTSWHWLYTLRPADWGVLIFGSVVIYTMNTYWLQICTRRIGANMFSVFVSLRLVASIIGSIVLLHDIPQSGLTWAGFAVVFAVMTAFLVYQQLHGRQAAALATAAGGDDKAIDAAVQRAADTAPVACRRDDGDAKVVDRYCCNAANMEQQRQQHSAMQLNH